MSLYKKSDVKNHLSPPYIRGIHLYRPVSQPDATGFSEEGSAHPDTAPDHGIDESKGQPSSSGREIPTVNIESISGNATPTVES